MIFPHAEGKELLSKRQVSYTQGRKRKKYLIVT
jgi:hypothetical protein